MAPETIRAELAPFVVGALLLVLGAASLLLGLLRRGDLTLLSFGAFCALYGLRLSAGTGLARLLLPASHSFWAHLDCDVTYLIALPGLVFFGQLVGGRWWPLFAWMLRIQAVYAGAAILIDLATGQPGAAMDPNAPLVLATQGLAVWALLRPGFTVTRDVRVLRGAYLVLLVFVVNENLADFGLPSVRGVEWIGFTLFVAVLAYVTARRVLEGERRLLSIAHEMETARRIQASILPRSLPSPAGVSLAVRYEPMATVAGDFYDLVEQDGGLGVLVADVSGHGVPAALVASMVKLAFAAQAPHAEDPGRVLGAMNQVLCACLDGPFVTAAYAWLDLPSRRLAYAAAGHPPLLVRTAEGVEAMGENGIVMGLVPGASYPVTHRQLDRGDRLLLYTDGLLKAANPEGEMFEGERLAGLLAEAEPDASRFAGRLLDRLHRWRGGPSGFDDDLTLVVVDV